MVLVSWTISSCISSIWNGTSPSSFDSLDTGCSSFCTCSTQILKMRALGCCQPALASKQWPREFLFRTCTEVRIDSSLFMMRFSTAFKMKEQMVLMGEQGYKVQDGIVIMLITRQQIPQCFLLAWKMIVPSWRLCESEMSRTRALGRWGRLISSSCWFWDVAIVFF